MCGSFPYGFGGSWKLSAIEWKLSAIEWKLSAIDPHDRDSWRSGVRSAMGAARHLPGRGPTDMDIVPVPAC